MSTDTPTKLVRRKGQEYTDEEIVQGQTMTVLCRGNTRRASDNLARVGLKIPHQTLEKWKNRSRREQYLEIERREAQGMKLDLAEKLQDFVDTVAGSLLESLPLGAEQLKDPNLGLKERASSTKDYFVAAGIANQNAMALRGDATTIVEHRTVDESVGGLKRLGLVIDSTAHEVVPASLPAATPSE